VIQQDDEQLPKITPPPRSKLFLEQMKSDQLRSAEIYKSYQKDVLKLKNLVDSRYISLLDSGMVSISDSNSIKIHAEVEGIGPKFIIRVSLTNESQEAMVGLKMTCRLDTKIYQLVGNLPGIGCLLPYKPFIATIIVNNISEVGANGSIKIFVFEPGKTQPISGAIINMPLSDISIE
jgi:hypothetical protein